MIKKIIYKTIWYNTKVDEGAGDYVPEFSGLAFN